jgi:ParB family chromosome partitioning protein
VLIAMLREVAGDAIAQANAGEKTGVLKSIIRGHLDGTDGREKHENWVPGWMRFPPAAYTARGGVGARSGGKGRAHDRAG